MQDDSNQSKQHGRNREDRSVTAEVMYTLINIIDHGKVIEFIDDNVVVLCYSIM
jgi:hypothetical protein